METMAIEIAKPPESRAARREALAHALVGLFIVSVLPALFWTGLLATLAPVFGYAPDLGHLMLLGGTIALFLGLVFTGIALSPEGEKSPTSR